jgi:hypothetical protein
VSKKIYLINSFFGIVVGLLLLASFGLQIAKGTGTIGESIPWIVAGIIGIIFGVYELKKYRASK